MNKLIVSVFLGLIVVAPLGLVASIKAPEVQKVAVQYGHKRPFSFYYPYNYKFYYPRPEYHRSASSCYWQYTNGTYVYTCD